MRKHAIKFILVATAGLGAAVAAASQIPVETDGSFLESLRSVHSESRAVAEQYNYGFGLKWTGQGYTCLDQYGRHGYNTALASDVLRSRQGECADLRGADLSRATLTGASLGGANFFGGKLIGAFLEGGELMGAVLAGVDLTGASLGSVNLYGANMAGAVLSKASLFLADATAADLHGAKLLGTYAVYATLKGANLSKADLRGANLQDADLTDADLAGAAYDASTRLPFDAQEAARRGMIRTN